MIQSILKFCVIKPFYICLDILQYVKKSVRMERLLLIIHIYGYRPEYLADVVVPFLSNKISLSDCGGRLCDNASNMSENIQYSNLDFKKRRNALYTPHA